VSAHTWSEDTDEEGNPVGVWIRDDGAIVSKPAAAAGFWAYTPAGQPLRGQKKRARSFKTADRARQALDAEDNVSTEEPPHPVEKTVLEQSLADAEERREAGAKAPIPVDGSATFVERLSVAQTAELAPPVFDIEPAPAVVDPPSSRKLAAEFGLAMPAGFSVQVEELRRSVLTATDLGALLPLGVDWGYLSGPLQPTPWRTPLDVYVHKTTGRERPVGDAAKFGALLEPAVLALYLDAHPVDRSFRRPGTVKSKVDDIVGATPDAIVDGRIVEAKTSSQFWEELPDYYAAQVHWQWLAMGDEVEGDVAHVPRLYTHFGFKFDIWIQELDAQFAAGLLELARKFWTDHIVAECPPEIVAADRSQALSRLHPVAPDPKHVEATEKAEAIYGLLRDKYSLERESLDIAIAKLEALLQSEMKRAGGFEFADGHKMTWRNPRAIDWEAIAMELGCSPADVARHTSIDWRAIAQQFKVPKAVVDKHATTDEASRRFCPNYNRIKR